ncbi:MAG: DUF4861 family protein [Bacteroidales bacterium]|nr:DUF4861 family protein [Bacteroidales bacterium]
MKKYYLILLIITVSCQRGKFSEDVKIVVTNPHPFELKDIVLEISDDSLNIPAEKFQNTQLAAFIGSEEICVEHQKPDWSDSGGRLFLNVSLPALSETSIELKFEKRDDSGSCSKRTLAELWHKTGGEFVDHKYVGGGAFQPVDSLRVPEECTDHSFYIKYEGPGWESDKVGYRLYLDWRNAIDVFGKKTPHMVLPEVGQDGYESYHNMSEWGMDVLKVGSSLGIGTVAYWDGKNAQRVAVTDSVMCRIKANTDLFSEVKTDYYGWEAGNNKLTLESYLSIKAGSRATYHRLKIKGQIDNLCTGIGKDPNAEVIIGEKNAGWNYLATWGKQSLNGDLLGLAVLFPVDRLIQVSEDEYSYVVVLSPENNRLGYYFLAAWELEPDAIKSKTEFIDYLEEYCALLTQPVFVKIQNQIKTGNNR